MVDWSSLGSLAKEFLLNVPFGVGIGGQQAPRFTIASAIKPWTDQRNRAEGLTQLKGMGLLSDDIDTEKLSKMDPHLMGMALQLMNKRGTEARLGDVPGAMEAFYPGVKEPQATKSYGVMAPEVGEGPTLTSTPPPVEEQARWQQISGVTLPRQQIWKTIGEAKGRKANADAIRRLFPEFAEEIPDELSTPEMTTARSTFAATRKQKQAEAKEQAFSDAAAQQYGLPPGMPPALAKEELLRQRQQKAMDAQMERFNQSQAAIASRFAQGQAASEARMGRTMGEWDRRQGELEKLREKHAGEAETRKAEHDLVRDIDVSIRDAKNRLAKYEVEGMLLKPSEKEPRTAEIQTEIRQLEQRKRQIQKERLKTSPLASTTGKGGVEEFEDLFK